MRVLITGGSGFIGTNLVESLRFRAEAVLSLDAKNPQNLAQVDVFEQVDLLDAAGLQAVLCRFKPTHVVHLGARTDLAEGDMETVFAANIQGTRNLLAAIGAAGSVQRCIFTSSKFVCRNGYIPKHDEDYCPHTVYGESKMEMEKIIRRYPRQQWDWCMVRPTSIWGPWFGVPYRDFFLIVAEGKYVNLGNVDLPRSYGYVKNTIFQLETILNADREKIDGQTFYLCDYEDYYINAWAKLVAAEMGRGRIITIPEFMVRALAIAGDGLKRLGYPNPPMTSFRLQNMRTNTAGLPYKNLQALTGPLPYDVKTGVKETVAWLRENKLIQCQKKQ